MISKCSQLGAAVISNKRMTGYKTVSISSLPQWLQGAVLKFKANNKRYQDRKEAFGECFHASRAFLDFIRRELERLSMRTRDRLKIDVVFLAEYEYYAKLIEKAKRAYEPDPKDPPFYEFGDEHWGARVGDYVIDWTARQYSGRLAFPRVMRMKDA